LAIALPNTHELLIAYFGCALIGVIVVPLDTAYGLKELTYMIETTTPKGFFICNNPNFNSYIELMNQLVPELNNSKKGQLNSKQFPSLKHIILLNNHKTNVWSYDILVSERLNNSKTHDLPLVETDDTFGIIFTVIHFY
jgi:fatty-acyl-CoA synthase